MNGKGILISDRGMFALHSKHIGAATICIGILVLLSAGICVVSACETHVLVNTGDSIQNAIDSICPEGGLVELATGIHTVSTTISILDRQNITIRGAGVTREDTKIAPSGVNVFNLSNVSDSMFADFYINSSGYAGTGFYCFGLNNVTLDNIQVEGGTGLVLKTYTETISPPFTYSYNITINDCLFNDIGMGFLFYGTHYTKMTNTEIANTNTMGGYINGHNHNFTIDNCSVHHCGMTGIDVYSSCYDVTIKNSSFYSCNHQALTVYSCNFNTTITNNTIRDNNREGIEITARSTGPGDLVIANNRIYNNDQYGVWFYENGLAAEASPTATIINNVVYNNGADGDYDGIYSQNVPGRYQVIVKNNIITNNTRYGTNVNQGNFTCSYNNVWGNSLGCYNGTIGGTDSISVDPLFADPANGDFHLKSSAGRWTESGWIYRDTKNSLCIDAGDPSSDYSNELCYPDGHINLGAYGNTVEASLTSLSQNNSPPYKPSDPLPSDGATDSPTDANLSWTGGDPDAGDVVTYDVYFGTDTNPPQVVENLHVTIYDPGTLSNGTKYYWQIVAKDEHDTFNEGEVESFTTASAPCSDLIGMWHFDEGTGEITVDSSGNGNNGTLMNMEAGDWVLGKYGKALDFDGTNDYLNCGSSESLNITEAITITAWLKIADPDLSRYMRIVSKKLTWSADNGYELEYNPALNRLTILGSGGDPGYAANVNLDTDWHHVAGIIDGTTATLYVDGVNKTTDSTVAALVSGTQSLCIGKQSGGTYYFNGTIDELKLYNRALTTEEIQADYEAGLNGTANSLSGTVTSPDSTGITGATVTLATLEGAVINTTQTDSTGNYEFTDVAPDFYNITATKRGYWPDSDPVTVNASEPKAADIVLCRKGDFNTNSEPADAGDLAMMADATVNATLRDETYDLDGDGNPADEDDLTLLKEVSVGVAELE